MKDKIYHLIANLLPRQLIIWCVIIVFSEATTGKFSNTVASELTVYEALERFGG